MLHEFTFVDDNDKPYDDLEPLVLSDKEYAEYLDIAREHVPQLIASYVQQCMNEGEHYPQITHEIYDELEHQAVSIFIVEAIEHAVETHPRRSWIRRFVDWFKA